MKKNIFALLFVLSLLSFSFSVTAQETTESTSAEITVEEMGINEQTVLPGDGIGYWFKNLGRGLQETFTFNPEKKSELQLKHASERLAEIQSALEQKKDDPKLQELIAKNQDKYQELVEKVSARIEKMQVKNEELSQKMLEKFTDAQLKQQEFLQKIEEKNASLTPEQIEKIKTGREKALERFGQVLEKMESKGDKIQERLEKVLDNGSENPLRKLEQLRVLENLSGMLNSEPLKEGLMQAKETARENLLDTLTENSTPAQSEVFKNKLENLNEDSATKLKLFNFIDERLKERARTENSLNRFGQRIDEAEKTDEQTLKNSLEQAGSEAERKELLKSLENGEINSVRVLDKVQSLLKNEKAKEALNQAREKQVEMLNDRVNAIENPEQAREIRQKIQTNPQIRQDLQKADPEAMKRLEEKAANRQEQQLENRPNIKPEAGRQNTPTRPGNTQIPATTNQQNQNSLKP